MEDRAQPPLVVPVRTGAMTQSLRLFRTVSGARTAIAFTSPARLTRVLGPEQPWTYLSEPALRGMIGELGVRGIVLDPAGAFTAPAAEREVA
ncbi:SAV_915 family protein [Sphaerisporangium sp. TRM90804]|uniref:SAV_915 family protein n=1 Tax=Sphaerisporangium sp. TRM90804 TaxID=3031113 RepID=UPI0024496A4F|nr:SAV_915 family protein [Sphaerisporangium sp. TRM90804]MDH2425456.1 hypothetical protein [Sphaerisporangium sp. TRM90804]